MENEEVKAEYPEPLHKLFHDNEISLFILSEGLAEYNGKIADHGATQTLPGADERAQSEAIFREALELKRNCDDLLSAFDAFYKKSNTLYRKINPAAYK